MALPLYLKMFLDIEAKPGKCFLWNKVGVKLDMNSWTARAGDLPTIHRLMIPLREQYSYDKQRTDLSTARSQDKSFNIKND